MHEMSFRACSLYAFVVTLVGVFQPVVSAADWQGYDKVEFLVGRRYAFLIEPRQRAAGHPWIWRTEFFGHEPQADLELLKRGFVVAYIDLQNLYGAPVAMEPMDAFYAEATKTYGLSPRVVLEGFSRGGLFALNWAAVNPQKVACIYNDAPVCDFKSWPAGKGSGMGSPADWDRLKGVYGFKSDAQAEAYRLNPVDNLAPLAAAKIPLLHVCGETDDVVPLAENSALVAQRYKDLGGSMTLIAKPHCNHHPHSLKDPTRIVNFILSHTGFADQVQAANTPYGNEYFKLRGGLENARQKFVREKVGRVAFLGGSITAAPGWRDQVCADLKRRFPETQFDFINAGISSLGSTPGAFRFRRDVLANGPVDLLFEEAAVNDDTNEFSDIEQVRGMEGIVRHARIANPNVDIVLLHFVDPGKIQQYNQGKTPSVIANHEKVAERYLLPSIDLAKEVTERIHAGEMTWERDFRDLHPSPFGHDLYAKSVGRLFDAAWSAEPEKSAQPRNQELPPPVDPFSYFRGQLVSPKTAVSTGDLKLNSGWSIVENWQPSDGAGTRDGFVKVPTLVAVETGADLTFDFQGTAVGVFVAAGPDTGNLDFRIDRGDWKTQELFTKWSSGLHLPWAKMLASELSDGRHQLQLKVSPTADQRSKGHAIRIVYLLVN